MAAGLPLSWGLGLGCELLLLDSLLVLGLHTPVRRVLLGTQAGRYWEGDSCRQEGGLTLLLIAGPHCLGASRDLPKIPKQLWKQNKHP